MAESEAEEEGWDGRCGDEADGNRPANGRNKVKPMTVDIARVPKRKELLSKEVPKSEKSSLVDRWLRYQVRPQTWDNCATTFP